MSADSLTRIHSWEDIKPGMIIWARVFLPHQKKELEESLNECEKCIKLIEEDPKLSLKRRHNLISVRTARPVLVLEKLATHATIKAVTRLHEGHSDTSAFKRECARFQRKTSTYYPISPRTGCDGYHAILLPGINNDKVRGYIDLVTELSVGKLDVLYSYKGIRLPVDGFEAILSARKAVGPCSCECSAIQPLPSSDPAFGDTGRLSSTTIERDRNLEPASPAPALPATTRDYARQLESIQAIVQRLYDDSVRGELRQIDLQADLRTILGDIDSPRPTPPHTTVQRQHGQQQSTSPHADTHSRRVSRYVPPTPSQHSRVPPHDRKRRLSPSKSSKSSQSCNQHLDKRQRRDDDNDPPKGRRNFGSGSSYRGGAASRPTSHGNRQHNIKDSRHDSAQENRTRTTGRKISDGTEDKVSTDRLIGNDIDRQYCDDSDDSNDDDDGDDDVPGEDWVWVANEKDNRTGDTSTSVCFDNRASEEWPVPAYISDDESDDTSTSICFDGWASEEWTVPEHVTEDQSLDVPACIFDDPAKERDCSWTDRALTSESGLTGVRMCAGLPDDNEHTAGAADATVTAGLESSPRFYRVSGVPPSWNEKDLLNALRKSDPSFGKWEKTSGQLSLYPSCVGTEQTALLSWKHPPLRYQRLGVTRTIRLAFQLAVSDTAMPTTTGAVIDCNFCGLTPLNAPGTKIVADVVAVTGLGGRAFESWKSRTSPQMWLKDFLPHDVENIRIMTYGYNRVFSGDRATEGNRPTLTDYREHFLQELDKSRRSNQTRPIIFIAHSLGGILVLQALIESKRNPSRGHILSATHSIMFFGIPNPGVTCGLEEMVDSDLNDTGQVREDLLEQLREGSNFLENHANDLHDIWNNYKPTVFSFYGTSKTDMSMSGSGSELIYRAFHHIHPLPVNTFQIEKNHRDMVKFTSVDDSTYLTVLERLRALVDDITKSNLTPAPRKHGILRCPRDSSDCLKSLMPADCESYRDRIWQRRHENTGAWILDNKSFQAWRQDDCTPTLWIHGSPGCGKTVLSTYVIQALDSGSTQANSHQVFYFFCDGRDERLRTGNAVLANLLAQLLKQTPEMIVHFAAESEYAMRKEKTSWTFEMLWRVFERIMNDDTIKNCFLIIDALDECEEQSRTELLSRLHRLLLCDRLIGPRIKLIITSRPHTPIASHLTDAVRLSLDSNSDEIKSDIAEFVETSVSKLRKSTASSNLGDEIVKAITTGSNGMFLWASLAVKELQASTFTAPRDIRKTLNTLPASLGEVYTNILRRVSSDNRPTAKEILRWVAFAQRPLTLQELSIAIAVRPEDTSMASIADNMETDLRKVVPRLLGPIIEIRSDDTVHFVHFSVKEFLMGMNDWSEGHAYRDELSPFLLSYTYSHSRIAVACLTFLAFDEFEEESKAVLFEQDSCHQHTVEDQCRKNQFLGYAAYYWFEHARQTREGSDEYEACYRAFLRLGEYAGKLDLAYLVFTSLHNKTFVSTTPLHFVASLGFSSFTHKLLSQKEKMDAQVALSLGDDETFGALSKFDYYSIGLVLCELEMGWEYDEHEGKGGLDMGGNAIGDKRMGGESIARLLVEKVAPNNTKRDIYGYALHAAAWNGREDMVKWLVGKDVDINAERGICGTALHIAAASGHEKVAKILLDAGAAVQDDIDTPRNSCVRDTVTRIIRQVPSNTLTLGANFASALRITGLWNEAAMVLERIVQKSTSLLGPEHPNTLNSMAILAHIYADLGRMEAAFDLLQKVFDTRTLTLGKDHPDTKYSRECLCSCVTGSVHWQDVEGEYKVRLWLAMNHGLDG